MPGDALTIAIVGGGVYAPRLCEALARAVTAESVEIRLSARNPERLRVLANHAGGRVREIRPGWWVTAASSLDEALEGAALVVLLVRVGGFAARSWDDEFPRRFGLVGDEGLGPGGVANAWRTVPELERIADAIGRMAPHARILNLMAPLGITTRLLLDRRLDAVGLCDLPVVTLQRWLDAAGAEPADVRWRYGGLNHLGWLWDVEWRGQDLLRLLADDPEIARAGFPIDGETVARFDAAPLRYYYEIFDSAARARLGLERRAGRAEELSALAERLMDRFAEEPGVDHPEAHHRATPWLDLAVAPIAGALLGGAPHAGFANVRNDGIVPELAGELVVEVAATYSERGIDVVRPGPLPPAVATFLRSVAEVETLAYQAATRRTTGLVEEAMRALPLDVGEDAVRELAALARSDPRSA